MDVENSAEKDIIVGGSVVRRNRKDFGLPLRS